MPNIYVCTAKQNSRLCPDGHTWPEIKLKNKSHTREQVLEASLVILGLGRGARNLKILYREFSHLDHH